MSGSVSTQQQTPDLVFYYTINEGIGQETTRFNNSAKTSFNKDLARSLYADRSLKNKIGETSKLFTKFANLDTMSDENYSFGFGTIFSKGYYKDFNDFFLGSNLSSNLQIIGGTQHFQNARGFIKINTDDTDVRKVEVFFTHNK